MSRKFSDLQRTSLLYHDFFDYPLTTKQLDQWTCGLTIAPSTRFLVNQQGDYFFRRGRESLPTIRKQREAASQNKLHIARKAIEALLPIPTIKLIAVTGSLAMTNAAENSDIDLLIVTQKETLWLTRIVVFIYLFYRGIPTRKVGDTNQKNKVCLNMWLDESDLVWPKNDRNLYTAHEIAQIVPVFDRDNTYQRLLSANRWILDYWPNAVEINKLNIKDQSHNFKFKVFDMSFCTLLFALCVRVRFVESFARLIQYLYMKSKITRETITPTRAVFHPTNWGNIVLEKLKTN